MARIFKTPFGAQGDTEQVPEAPQGDGSVSLTQGFGYDYEREYEDPAAKDIRREVINGLFHDVTEAIGDIQLTGIAKWDATAAPYPAGAVVWHNNTAWTSAAGNNSSVPGAGGDWSAVTGEQEWSAETVSQAEAQAGTSTTRRAWTAERVRQAINGPFGGSNQSLGTNGHQILPGGLIIQWGQGESVSGTTKLNEFPIAFPNACASVVCTANSAGASNAIAVAIGSKTTTYFYAKTSDGSSFDYIAIGY